MTDAGRIAVVIGDPIEHSLSPAIHNAAFAALDLPHRFETRQVGIDAVPDAVGAMRSERWLGMSVTMPDKEAVIGPLDGLTPIAERLGAVNCVFWAGDRLIGDNTDGAGVVWALEAELGVVVSGRSVVVIGAGGAARAAVAALGEAGAASILVLNRTASRAASAAALAPARGRVGSLADLDDADIVINATPVGMGGTGGTGGDAEMPVPFVPDAGVVAMDLIYHPAETRWLAAARANGATVVNGVPMLVGQAVAAFERWTGHDAPVAAMSAAATAALGRS